MGRRSDSNIGRQVVSRRGHRPIDRMRYRRSRLKGLVAFMSSLRGVAKPATIVAGGILIIVGYNVLAGSALFDLKRVQVTGASESLGVEIEQTVRRAVSGAKLLDVDLATVRQKVESLPRVRRASIARVLPDELRLDVTERQPAVLVRRESSGSLVWLDDDAVELGELGSIRPGLKDVPPVAKGFAEGERSAAALADDRERIATYKQIERELNEGANPLWELVDEVDLKYLKDVYLHLAKPPVTVHVGSRDFRNRFETALKILDAARRGDAELLRRYRISDSEDVIERVDRINFVEAARPDRVVVAFSGPAAQKTVKQEERPAQAPKKKNQ